MTSSMFGSISSYVAGLKLDPIDAFAIEHYINYFMEQQNTQEQQLTTVSDLFNHNLQYEGTQIYENIDALAKMLRLSDSFDMIMMATENMVLSEDQMVVQVRLITAYTSRKPLAEATILHNKSLRNQNLNLSHKKSNQLVRCMTSCLIRPECKMLFADFTKEVLAISDAFRYLSVTNARMEDFLTKHSDVFELSSNGTKIGLRDASVYIDRSAAEMKSFLTNILNEENPIPLDRVFGRFNELSPETQLMVKRTRDSLRKCIGVDNPEYSFGDIYGVKVLQKASETNEVDQVVCVSKLDVCDERDEVEEKRIVWFRAGRGYGIWTAENPTGKRQYCTELFKSINILPASHRQPNLSAKLPSCLTDLKLGKWIQRTFQSTHIVEPFLTKLLDEEDPISIIYVFKRFEELYPKWQRTMAYSKCAQAFTLFISEYKPADSEITTRRLVQDGKELELSQ